MKRLLPLIAILTLSTSLHAEHWVEVTASDGGAVRQYVDIDGIERNLGHVELPRLFSIDASKQAAIDASHPASQRVTTEVDCGARAMRDVHAVAYSQPMAQGDKLHEIPLSSDWVIDPQDDFARPLWQIACGD